MAGLRYHIEFSRQKVSTIGSKGFSLARTADAVLQSRYLQHDFK